MEGDYKSPPSIDVMSDYDEKNSTKSSKVGISKLLGSISF